MPTHLTLSGREIEYPEPTPDLARLLRRLRDMLDDPKATENEMIALAYSRDNPLLGPDLFPDRGAVTRETLLDPAYHVITDLIYRKHVAEHSIDVEQLASTFTLTPSEAAERLGIHESAVRQAVAAFRLPAWVRNGRYYLSPRSLETFRLANRGPQVGVGERLAVRLGVKDGYSLRVKYPGRHIGSRVAGDTAVELGIEKWRRVAVLTGDSRREEKRYKLFILEPSTKHAEIKWGTFFVRGHFAIAEEHAGSAANDGFKRFTPA